MDGTDLTQLVTSRLEDNCNLFAMTALTIKQRFLTDDAKGALASPILIVLGMSENHGSILLFHAKESY